MTKVERDFFMVDSGVWVQRASVRILEWVRDWLLVAEQAQVLGWVRLFCRLGWRGAGAMVGKGRRADS